MKIDAKPIQLIDHNMELVGDVETFMDEANLHSVQLDYAVVTVLGCQSSGKSTLLNRTFGTNFQELNAQQGIQQTTKGLWLSKDKKSNTLVLDCEGTDSGERGDDNKINIFTRT
eukprot:GHVL01000276.1.p1 GENE.GHVL01000276.1~~GHVL01000276.1.p1  ORF type:complete len:114 (+),score=12.86 GHVL01000276.1:69-410(+)